MKILIISPCYLPVPAVRGGAVATLIESLIKENNINQQGKIDVISSYDTAAITKARIYEGTEFLWVKIPDIIEKIDYVVDWILQKLRLNKKPKRVLGKICVIRKVKRILSKKSYDRVIVQNSGYLLKIFKSSKLLSKYKDRMYYHLHNDIPINADVKVLQHFKFLLISNYLKKGVINLCGKEAGSRCIIVKNGIDIGKFTRKLDADCRKEFRNSLGINEGDKVIIFVGRINASKGIKELLEAIKRIEEKTIKVLIVGSTNFGTSEISLYEHNIQTICKELKERAIFTGFIDNDSLWQYYKSADIAVLPSIWEEPAGLTMIEAAVSGIPVMTTKVGGIPEYLNENHAIMLDKDEFIIDNIRVKILEFFEKGKWQVDINEAVEYVSHNFTEKVFYDSFMEALNS